MEGMNALDYGFKPGCYEARMLIETRLFGEVRAKWLGMTHLININKEGVIRESGFVCHLFSNIHVFSDEGRLWHPSILKGHELTEIISCPLYSSYRKTRSDTFNIPEQVEA